MVTLKQKIMEIVLSERMVQPSVKKVEESIDLVNELRNFLTNKGINLKEDSINVQGDQISLRQIPKIHLHSFSLHLERLGRELEFEKKTILRVK